MALTLRLAEWVISNARWILMGGMALILVSVQFDGPGVFTGSSAIWLGASGGCFRRWRAEPGLWMLAGLFLAMALTVFIVFTYAWVSDLLQARFSGLIDLDALAGIGLLAVVVLFLAEVVRKNWSLRKKTGMLDL